MEKNRVRVTEGTRGVPGARGQGFPDRVPGVRDDSPCFRGASAPSQPPLHWEPSPRPEAPNVASSSAFTPRLPHAEALLGSGPWYAASLIGKQEARRWRPSRQAPEPQSSCTNDATPCPSLPQWTAPLCPSTPSCPVSMAPPGGQREHPRLQRLPPPMASLPARHLWLPSKARSGAQEAT